ncbi:prepilin-type N-terminal cleavage/methylation domain-containing protein [Patescibacteria group bacterium]|nr:prepilin-type N-terminal cleavage/methylation domain-containing protein [Patescibacteria group bacterium]MCL5010329.1 prepilin-type N-terminal cleavage/methylation domain-containing protein [Patescibacteria group bacterium]
MKLKITNFKLQISNSLGYTLIELLAVMAVLVVVGAVVGQILFSVLRGNNKTNTLSSVNQNGSYAISQMSKMIRNTQFFNGVSIDGSTYITDCVTSSVGALTPTPTPETYKSLKITSFDGGETIFSCDLASSPPTISSNSASLLDTNAVEIDMSSSNPCYFTCSQDSFSGSTRIGIHFSLKEFSNSGVTPIEEKSASAVFDTSVILRNPSR